LVPEQRNIGVVGEGGRRHNTLDKESSVAEFDVLQGVIDYGNEDKQTKRGAELRGAAEADGLLRQARQRVKRHAEGVRGRLKRSVDDTGGREGDAEREHAGADSGERRGYGEELKRQLGATVETPPPQPGLQAEVDELKRKLQSVETQDEPRLRAEVDELKRQLGLGGSAVTENDELRRRLQSMEKRALAASSVGGGGGGLSSIKQAINKQGTLQKKSKYFGLWQERAITLTWLATSRGTGAAATGTL